MRITVTTTTVCVVCVQNVLVHDIHMGSHNKMASTKNKPTVDCPFGNGTYNISAISEHDMTCLRNKNRKTFACEHCAKVFQTRSGHRRHVICRNIAKSTQTPTTSKCIQTQTEISLTAKECIGWVGR